jgi:outer membrane protein assembly factor BamE (lipoprotein component of BamABCDE complex)
MRKLTISCFILTFGLLLMCAPSLDAQNKRTPKYVVSYNSFGPVKIGMTLSQVAKVLGVPVTRDIGYEGNECYYASPKRGFKDIAFMMSGQRIVRVDIDSKEYATDRGARVGDTEAKIKRLYTGRVKVSQHPYVDSGHYLEVEFEGGKYSLIFETDGKRVTRFRGGRSPEVGYIEGCS